MLLDTPQSVSVCNGDLEREVNLQWDSVPGAITYIIEFKTDTANNWIVADTVINPKCTITGLKNNTFYCFRVAALNSKGQSKWSKTIKKKLIIKKGETKMKHSVKTSAVITMLFLVTLASVAQVTQQWAGRYNSAYNKDDNAVSVKTDAASNVYVAGNIKTTSNYDGISIVKYNSSGTVQWSVNFLNPFDNRSVRVNQMVTDNSGNVYIAGLYDNPLPSGYDFLILKYSNSGTLLWYRTWSYLTSNSNDIASSIALDASGNVFVTGSCDNNAQFGRIATLKYSSSGNIQWAQTYFVTGWSGNHYGRKIITDASGNCYVTGTGKSDVNGSNQYVTLKYNSTGNLQWAQYNIANANYNSRPNDIAIDGSGNVFVTGESYTSLTNSEWRTIKYSSLGVFQWVKTYNGNANLVDKAVSIDVDGTGYIYVTGYTFNTATASDFTTIKYNTSGNSLWVQNYNGTGNSTDAATDIFVDGSGNSYTTGYSAGSGSGYDYATVKYNANGVQQWAQRYNGPANGPDSPSDVFVDNTGNVYVTGNSVGIGTFVDYATVKYSQTTGIEPISGIIPDKFNLSQNYPNPFNPTTNIEFSLPVSGNVKISVYDMLGKEVSVLANQFMQAGTYKSDFDANSLPSGTYFYRIETEGFTDTKKMMLIK